LPVLPEGNRRRFRHLGGCQAGKLRGNQGRDRATCATSPGVQRGFCGRCGSSLTAGGDNWTDVGITAASLDDPGAVKPESNVYLDHQQPWVIIDETLRHYDKLP
jgi:hypothetical protein